METVTEISRNPFLGGKTLFLLEGSDFLSTEKNFFKFCASFLQMETVIKLAETSSMYFLWMTVRNI